MYYREDGEFHIEAYRRHPFLEQLEEQGLLVGHYAVPQGRPGRYRPLSEVAAGDVSRSVTPDTSRKRAGGYSDGSQEDQSENSSEDNDDAEVEVPADPAAASTSKGACAPCVALRSLRGKVAGRRRGLQTAHAPTSQVLFCLQWQALLLPPWHGIYPWIHSFLCLSGTKKLSTALQSSVVNIKGAHSAHISDPYSRWSPSANLLKRKTL